MACPVMTFAVDLCVRCDFGQPKCILFVALMEIISLEIKLIRIPGFSFVKNISPLYTCSSHTHPELLAISAMGSPERLQ